MTLIISEGITNKINLSENFRELEKITADIINNIYSLTGYFC
jgi:hypothetical protein